MCDIKSNAELRKIDQEFLEKEVKELGMYDFTEFTYDDWKDGYLFVEKELRKTWFKALDTTLAEKDDCILPYLFNVLRHMKQYSEDIPKTYTPKEKLKK